MVIHDVVEAYTAALLADAQLEVAPESLRTAEENVRMVSDLHDGGLVVQSDLLQAGWCRDWDSNPDGVTPQEISRLNEKGDKSTSY